MKKGKKEKKQNETKSKVEVMLGFAKWGKVDSTLR